MKRGKEVTGLCQWLSVACFHPAELTRLSQFYSGPNPSLQLSVFGRPAYCHGSSPPSDFQDLGRALAGHT